MSQWKALTDQSRERWDQVAGFWDDYMGEHSNRFHREIVRPSTERLLEVKEGDMVLDIACGNGNFSRRLADLGAQVVALDYSAVMIERAKQRSTSYEGRIDYQVADATDYDALLAFGAERYDCAVANMALMDIADIGPLTSALGQLLKRDGVFVFSIPHPSFQSPSARKIHESEEINGQIVTRNSVQISKYLTPESFETIGIRGQPVPHLLFHRPLSYYINLFLGAGFVMDGWEEPSFQLDADSTARFDWYELPPAVIFRFRKK
ncbi:2-polyprenyl-3-methyl-5-hydroxy-6-metoxy-1,4-benzoquinol methylase [Paenibacillus cellulosilyticus]|uniref:2-polyprenyl-3-methyl-5-hydroxy-6-metoxy-1, 4-benzoquinol methylase n=1 Tax=Paenibacillus cellulosilyticus TaxID=375489 RepID=A0A2V2YN36_9BACL|nr:class I SAM-dependent methyltransferase [Paenibacillus cellulosilyticus]PWV95832.1 2-polyprenyl-3-methyl-5-hydroxy-6-metoxy-1,4-benzoquinol methylase [Paenibacillus cellulosilyticus]QKS47709.1 methyltransferase domain-containing protein [Paenibacillus cellulosilyticus]